VAQFDVYRTGRGALVVCLQSDLLDGLPTRLVAPLLPAAGAADASPWKHLGTLLPRVTVEGRAMVADMTRLVAVPVPNLSGPLASLTAQGDEMERTVSILIHGP
jgi:toxin CcdB